MHDLAEILELAVDEVVDLGVGEQAGEAREEADLRLDFLTDGVPAGGDFGGFAEQRLGDEAFALDFELLRVADFCSSAASSATASGMELILQISLRG